MRIPVRPLAVAAVVGATLFAGPAAAQTVMARSAPPGEKVEVFLNGKPVGAATADPLGDAKIPVNMNVNLGKTEIDANVYVDGCDNVRRVWIVEIGKPAPSEGTCNLRTVAAVFWVRPANTIVVDVSATIPRVLLVKGTYKPPAPGTETEDGPERVLPEGLTLFGGSGYVNTVNGSANACGNVACSGDDTGFPFSAGAEYRFSGFLAAEASYIRVPTVTATGAGSSFNFTTEQAVNAYALAGKVGFQAGPARVYGKVGALYHQAKFTTMQTQQDVTVTVDDEPVTIEGGTQKFEYRTDGWKYILGGGFEVWPRERVAFYAEYLYGILKGEDVAGGEAILDDKFMGLFAGIRVNLFK